MEPFRDDPLAVQHQVGEISEHEAQGKGRGWKESQSVGGASRRLGELGIGDRIGHHGIHGAADCLIVQALQYHRSQIIDFDARHPLAARSKTPTEACPEDGLDRFHRSPIAAENESDTQSYHSDTVLLRLDCFGLPCLGDFSQESAPCRGILIGNPLSCVSVEADR